MSIQKLNQLIKKSLKRKTFTRKETEQERAKRSALGGELSREYEQQRSEK